MPIARALALVRTIGLEVAVMQRSFRTTRPIVRTIKDLWIVHFWRLWISASCPGSVPASVRGLVRKNAAQNH